MLDISNKPPASGINSSVRDLGLFMVALYGDKLVTPATWNQMITPATMLDGKPTIHGYGGFVGGRSARTTACAKSATAALFRDLRACSMR